MNLSEFIRKNDIKCSDGAEFDHSTDFYKMKQFERTSHIVQKIPFLEPETYVIRDLNVYLTGYIKEKWDKREKKSKRQFFVNRSFTYTDTQYAIETIEDMFSAGKTIDEAIAMLEAEKNRFEFFRKHDLVDAGKYWLNRKLKRCLVNDGQVIVIDE